MSMKELKERLYEMARQTKGGLRLDFHVPVIETILRQYAVRADYYEEDVIASMERLLERGILSFENCEETRRIYCAMQGR